MDRSTFKGVQRKIYKMVLQNRIEKRLLHGKTQVVPDGKDKGEQREPAELSFGGSEKSKQTPLRCGQISRHERNGRALFRAVSVGVSDS